MLKESETEVQKQQALQKKNLKNASKQDKVRASCGDARARSRGCPAQWPVLRHFFSAMRAAPTHGVTEFVVRVADL